jgi:chitinase
MTVTETIPIATAANKAILPLFHRWPAGSPRKDMPQEGQNRNTGFNSMAQDGHLVGVKFSMLPHVRVALVRHRPMKAGMTMLNKHASLTKG